MRIHHGGFHIPAPGQTIERRLQQVFHRTIACRFVEDFKDHANILELNEMLSPGELQLVLRKLSHTMFQQDGWIIAVVLHEPSRSYPHNEPTLVLKDIASVGRVFLPAAVVDQYVILPESPTFNK